MSTPIAQAIAEAHEQMTYERLDKPHWSYRYHGEELAYKRVESREVVSEEVQALIEGAKQPCIWESNPVVDCGTMMCWPCGARHVLERLREAEVRCCKGCPDCVGIGPREQLIANADEIERLRNALHLIAEGEYDYGSHIAERALDD